MKQQQQQHNWMLKEAEVKFIHMQKMAYKSSETKLR